jgi:NADPH-dependent 2,4-dienoyl-CoA reductase/sulfur reductase-like enzyme
MVAGYAAKEFVERGLKPGELTLISTDDAIPYERPPLSKSFLAGKDSEDSILINPDSFYREHGIAVQLRTEVTRVDCGRKRLLLRTGEEVGYDQLVIATGARVRTLGGGPDVLYLRSMGDSKRIRAAAESAKRAVVIGSGFIGMEVAAVLAQKGVDTTMVLREDRIWKSFFTPEMSSFFERYYSDRGVRFAKQTSVSEFSRDRVQLANGQSVACDIVVAGVGVEPVTEVLAGSGINVDNGVTVNEYLETNQPGVYAAGDVANYMDVIFGKRRRVEHWDNAVSQGQHCARLLTGTREPFVHVPYFFSDVFDLSYEFWGDPAGHDRVEYRGDVTTREFSTWWLQGARLMAAFVMNRPDQERQLAPEAIKSKQPVSIP